jgi:hypothetical protein
MLLDAEPVARRGCAPLGQWVVPKETDDGWHVGHVWIRRVRLPIENAAMFNVDRFGDFLLEYLEPSRASLDVGADGFDRMRTRWRSSCGNPISRQQSDATSPNMPADFKWRCFCMGGPLGLADACRAYSTKTCRS